VTEKTDSHYMKMALGLARRGCGSTWPNPAVGCVILDQSGHVAGRGHTGEGGRPHAETVALSRAGRAAEGGTAYVTLEPCAHHGQTPPCAEALIAAKLARVVVATGDPDPRVSGRGLTMLKNAGIDVDFGVCQAAADQVNEGFLKRISAHRPLITVKLATSLDGRIATASGESKWITGPDSRWRGHLLRANHDAILVGSGTVKADDPSLDCRLPGLESRSPVRIIVDSDLSVPLDSRVIETAEKSPTWIMTARPAADRRHALEQKAVKVIRCGADSEGQVNLPKMMNLLAEEGITRLLCEGGAQLNASLFRASLVDRVYWFRSSSVIGGDGLAAIAAIGVDDLSAAPRLSLVRSGRTGNDSWQEYKVGL